MPGEIPEQASSLPSALTDGGDGGDNLPQLQLVQDGGLPGSVQAHHQDAHLLLPNQALQKVPKDITHGYRSCFLRSVGPREGQWWSGFSLVLGMESLILDKGNRNALPSFASKDLRFTDIAKSQLEFIHCWSSTR